ncbi:MAG: hypothetical protein M1827_007645 [Pycnora praestabilis]|nr:MAG: hypothetical protein M1827_007645 [Pycnora praestabilis]
MPGVPPNALSDVKKALKGMFRKKKQQAASPAAEKPAQHSQAPTSTTKETAKPTATEAADPAPATAAAPTSSVPAEAPKLPEPVPADPLMTDGALHQTSAEPTLARDSAPVEEYKDLHPINTSEHAPGMSATSGPLEDHPHYEGTPTDAEETIDAERSMSEKGFTKMAEPTAVEDPTVTDGTPFATPMEAPRAEFVDKTTDLTSAAPSGMQGGTRAAQLLKQDLVV